ncbi:MAG: hypothetical protein RQ758_07415 [Methanomicrobiaceae archaeon]|nr:hypothetical protein [Methanomicrobiaceae archaeon]
MSKRAVDAVFQSLFLLSDLRTLLRETAPAHALDESQKESARSAITKLTRQVAIIEEELL